MTSSSQQPPETAKQFMLRMAGFTVAVFLMMSEVLSLFYLGIIIMTATGVLNIKWSDQELTRMVPLWLFGFAAFMAIHLINVIKPDQNVPPILTYHHAFAFTMIGVWSIGTILEYRKWRASRSNKPQ